MALQYFISSSLSNLLCLISIGFLLPINTIHALNNLKLLRSFGDGYNGGVRAEAIDFQLDSVYVPNSLMYLFGQRNVSRSGFFDFRRGLVVGDITVCFASRASGTRTYDKFVCPESDDGSKANSYAELVARPSAKSYCCGPGGSQRCCTHDQYSSGDKRKPSPKDSDEKSGLSKSMIAIICVSSVTGVVLIGLVIFCICHGCRNRKPKRRVMAGNSNNRQVLEEATLNQCRRRCGRRCRRRCGRQCRRRCHCRCRRRCRWHSRCLFPRLRRRP
ncbi:hypothetical protein BOX15_Mlig016960g1 [Macrostomum lignano]|uniref:Uncharacterized protein n=1 Tax=Macrostomum lignano TaxID=282301 RepID=A0A267ETQ3_9PLAT|nr:hypothetical protein BOX15_Mlig016960g1 [Macrostomum lignano]